MHCTAAGERRPTAAHVRMSTGRSLLKRGEPKEPATLSTSDGGRPSGPWDLIADYRKTLCPTFPKQMANDMRLRVAYINEQE